MNVLLMLAGFAALVTTVGHFTAGIRLYLNPLLCSDIEPVARKVLHAVFHYVSVFLVLSTVVLLRVGFGMESGHGAQLLTRFIALNYLAFGVWLLVLAKNSGIPQAPKKMFQWVFFFVIAVLALGGAGSL